MLLEIKQLGFSVKGRTLFSDISFQLDRGYKIGIVGPNGVGKSTLLNILSGQLSPDSGQIKMHPQVQIVSISQKMPEGDMLPVEWLRANDKELQLLEEQLQSENQDIGCIVDSLDELEEIRYKQRVPIILSGLGINSKMQEQPIENLSGGYKMRLNLALPLMLEPDILILDEPSNHLDLETAVWLTEYLKSYSGSIVLASHDSSFLNSVPNHILHFDGHTAILYSGNYSSFCQQRDKKIEHAERTNEKVQNKIERSQELINKKSKDPKWRGAVNTRKKWIEDAREQFIELSLEKKSIPFNFQSPSEIGNPLLEIRDVSFGYAPGSLVLEKINFAIQPGQKLAILGRNGQGKSTFCHLLSGLLKPCQGIIETNPQIRIAYFSQEQINSLDPQQTLYEFFQQRIEVPKHEEICRAVSEAGFDVKNAKKLTLENLSGGEKTRLVLLEIGYKKPHLLILDEPSNHLDMQSRMLLSKALNEFKGAVILISHDPEFVQSISSSLSIIYRKKITPYLQGVHHYISTLSKRAALSFNESPGTSLHFAYQPEKPSKSKLAPSSSLSSSSFSEKSKSLNKVSYKG